jgi:hypothetical protein
MLVSSSSVDSKTSEQRPADLDIVERTGEHLVQLDVSVRPRRADDTADLPLLTKGDFELELGGRIVPLEFADRVCQPGTDAAIVAERDADASGAVRSGSPPPVGAPTYVFYLEHKHLTMAGQQHAFVMAAQMIPELVHDGTRGVVMSSGQKLMQSELTDDAAALVSYVEQIMKSPSQWTEYAYAESEESRYRQVGRSMSAVHTARVFQLEEGLYTRGRLRRLAGTLGFMAEIDPPKVVFYFADIIRRRAGDHYMYPFESGTGPSANQAFMNLNSLAAIAEFDRVTEIAGAHGIRLYTVSARGDRKPILHGAIANRRLTEAEDTMKSLAAETGGAWFKGGEGRRGVERVVQRVREDLGCFYLLSFYPHELRQDSKLAVRVRFNVDSPRFEQLDRRFEIRSRGQTVVQSPGKRQESMLLAAHLATDVFDDPSGRGAVIPLGFEDGKYRALVQFVVSGVGIPAELAGAVSWDVGISQVHDGRVTRQIARHVESRTSRVPVVLEAEMEFRPGSTRLVMVGHEARYKQIASVDLELNWPGLNGTEVGLSPFAVVQPGEALFLREGKATDDDPEADAEATARPTEGPLATGQGAALLGRPIYVVGLVCRAKRNRDELRIERRLHGESVVEFDPQSWPYDSAERCVQIRDLIRAGQIGPGRYEYRIDVFVGGRTGQAPLARAVHEFAAFGPG